jgi:hypothetical protein
LWCKWLPEEEILKEKTGKTRIQRYKKTIENGDSDTEALFFIR